MNITKKLQDAINKQINAEMYSSYLYLSMSAYLENEGLPGFASWMRLQADEETVHAMKFFDYVNERGGRVTLEAIEKPPAEWSSPLAVFEETLAHEQKVTSLINDLVTLAKAENDYASESFLKWYVDEQVEEEASASEILDLLKRTGDSGHGLLLIDRQLAGRGAGGSGGKEGSE